MYLQLSQSEATAGTDATVVLDSGASHNRSELVDRTGCKGGSLSLAGNTSRGLLAGLYSKISLSDPVRKQGHSLPSWRSAIHFLLFHVRIKPIILG